VSPEGSPLDFVYRWKDAEARRDTGSDSVSVDGQEAQAGDLEVVESEGESHDGALEPAQEIPDEDLSDELFEWSADREQALIDAFEATPEGAVARVHQQIEQIALALQAGTLHREQAGPLLAEVEAYLTGKVKAEQRKPAVMDAAFAQSRADKSNALAAWLEAVAALRQYLESGEAVQLKIAFYAAEQASGFMTSSRDVLLACEPEWEAPADDDEGEEEIQDED
jgi:hypothetical protein